VRPNMFLTNDRELDRRKERLCGNKRERDSTEWSTEEQKPYKILNRCTGKYLFGLKNDIENKDRV